MDTPESRPDIAAAVEAASVTLGAKREIRELPGYLHVGEVVTHLAVGEFARKAGLLVLTGQRLLFVVHGVSRKAADAFPLAHVVTLEWKARMLTGEVIIGVGNVRAVVKGVNQADGKRLVDAARAAVQATRPPGTPPGMVVVPPPAYTPPRPPPVADEPRETLRRLREWHAEGLITAEEYAAKRAEVLGRI
ncbi:PH domain-containing protein [Phytomonospora endophytica]|uniref:YokE-like PH domain-containing protein n=1 Tax=Phytomonospora endophytica TaxID=714109 RepID=A0A841FMA9_9ACTN|nr:PH domain-containing protein [Phytomonospora endophytica]MBB6038451.1 hypothetical protein [Phytomonospora endophytica]GIG64380.1 hypothetical protein Pen01_06750 [Phytomonospora endophytica]